MSAPTWTWTRGPGGRTVGLLRSGRQYLGRWVWLASVPYPPGHEAHSRTLTGATALRAGTGATRTKLGAKLAAMRFLLEAEESFDE